MNSAPCIFTHALCRAPAPSAIHGIRADGGPDPDFAGLAAEHAAYVATLRDLGLSREEAGQEAQKWFWQA